jgi:hypothetical protein
MCFGPAMNIGSGVQVQTENPPSQWLLSCNP